VQIFDALISFSLSIYLEFVLRVRFARLEFGRVEEFAGQDVVQELLLRQHIDLQSTTQWLIRTPLFGTRR
jgi:hypothetical protein